MSEEIVEIFTIAAKIDILGYSKKKDPGKI
jgi:hypothetical protein